jgi:hypothetical protein
VNRDPFGLGVHLYGLAPAPVSPVGVRTLIAMGAMSMTLIPDAHDDCSIATFCRNPLHPGPCAGWKKKLGVEAPGALHAIESAHKAKVAANRTKRAEAKAAAAKTLTSRHHASPLHAKKALTKRANMLLGNDEAKASGKADKVILNKQEIAKYSKIKAAQINSFRTKHGLQEDPGLEDRLKDALAMDNKGGKDDNYRAAIEGSGASLGAQLAQKHCKKGDGDCDGKPYEELRDEFTVSATAALLSGDDSHIDTLIEDYDAGDFKPAGVAEAKKIAAEMKAAQEEKAKAAQLAENKAKAAQMMGEAKTKVDKMAKDNAAKEQAKADNKAKAAAMMDAAKAKTDKMAEDKAAEGAAKAAKAAKPKKAKAEPAPLEGNAAKADAGMKFGLGLLQFIKGNKTLGSKATQKEFADKIQAHLDGDPTKQETVAQAANLMADTLLTKVANASMAKPYLNLHTSEKNAAKLAMIEEIAKGLKGEDGPTPMVDAFKEALTAQNGHDFTGAKAAEAKVKGAIAAKAATDLGLPADTPPAVLAAKIVFKPGSNWKDGKTGQRVGVLNAMTPDEFAQLDDAEKQEVTNWLEDRAKALDTSADDPDFASVTAYAKMIELQQKFGLPEHQPEHDWGTPAAAAPPHVQDLKDAIATGSPSYQIKQAADKVSIAEVKQHLNADEQAKLKAAQAAPPPKPFDPNAPTPPAKGEVVTEDGKVVNLHEMFSDDGDPNHQEAVAAAHAMTQDDYDALAPWEKGNLWYHVSDADSAGEPGAESAALKVGKFAKDFNDKQAAATPTATGPASKPASALTPDAKAASDYANGFKSGTAKTKLTAYEKVSGEEFQQMLPNTQQLILADLKAIEGKFVDPKKKKAAKEHHDYLASHLPGAVTAPAASDGKPNDAEKLDAASKVMEDMISLVSDSPDPAAATAAATKMLATAQSGGTYDALTNELSKYQAKINMQKLDKLNGGKFDPNVADDIADQLAKDVHKKLHADPGATPVYDAWKKAMHSATPADAQKLAEAAGHPSLVGHPPATDTDVKALKGNTGMVLMDAWHDKPDAGAMGAGTVAKEVKEALSDGVGSPKHQKWAKQTADDAAQITLDTAFNNMHWSDDQVNDVPQAIMEAAHQTLQADYEKSLLSTEPYDGGKPAEYLKKAVKEINEASDKLAAAQGWDANSKPVKEYKQAVFQAKLENLPKMFPAPVTVKPAAPGTPAAKAATTGAPIHLGAGSVSPFTDDQNQLLTGTLKAQIVNLSSASTHDWDSLVAAAAAHAGKDGFPDQLSVMDVLTAVDAGHAKNLGVPNAGKLREKVLNWLKTPAGKQYAEDNATPKSSVLGQMTGELHPKLPPGVKIQPVSGPGAYKADYTPTDPGPNHTDGWRMQTWQEALADREAYWAANPGTKWTPEAKNAAISYTMGSATMNNWLRGETATGQPVPSASTATKQAVLDLQSAMVPLQKDTFLRRGTGWEQFPVGFRDPEALKKMVGKNFTDKAFLSTSVTGGGSHGFGSKPVGLEIEAPKGTHGLILEDVSAFAGGSEQEMLLAAGTTMRILSVKEVDGRTIVRVRVVTPK